SARRTESCLCALAPSTGRLTIVAGRPQQGLVATEVADLNLRVAERLEAAKLPASLAPAVLAAAVQDFVERANPLHPNDWLTLVRAAQAVPDDRIDDYIASLTTGGPFVIDRTAGDSGRRGWGIETAGRVTPPRGVRCFHCRRGRPRRSRSRSKSCRRQTTRTSAGRR